MQQSMMNGFSDGQGNPRGTGYIGAVQNAMQQPGGSNAWMQDQYGKAFANMQNDPRYREWGFDKYDWSSDPTYGNAYKSWKASQPPPAPPPVPTSNTSPNINGNAAKPATQTVQRPGNFSQNPMAGRTQNQRRYY